LPLHPGLIEKWEFQIITVMKRKLQEITAERLSLYRAQTMKPKTVEMFFNMLEKVATKNKISETSGNIFNLDENDIHINNKPDSIITEKVSKKFMF
jgi:predicted phosphatase